ncbi:RNA-binding cell elongation regulator Jag/EloR [Fructilactobacillus carniphilus]|uniref:RNA-binding protein KhpB n=1 Tax=Fructilactobacillus carniphilus TaxID=2940297 RepID=A0ABY5BVB3_9LACO|nr:RNA-binding cell elongation regulator Jag/EloR [Fructilactobacillus carniphilus]USS90444.1 protein jag [Fructilactobacillus carniphilus]
MPKYEGPTLAAAVNNGLAALNLTENEVNIEIIQQPSAGFLGFFKRPAQVSITKKATPQPPKKRAQRDSDPEKQPAKQPSPDRFERNFAVVKQLGQYLQNVLSEMDINATLEVEMPNSKHVYINCETDKEGLLIGKHGRTINALQQLCEFYLNNHGVNYVDVLLDTANYRERREQILTDLARKTAWNVQSTGQPVHLDAMPAFERKQIHVALEDFDDLITYSVGNEPNREVVIAPK